MIVRHLFRVTWLSTLVLLSYTIFKFVSFLSTQQIPQNNTDVPTWALFTTDMCLVVLFMVQHSGMSSDGYQDFMQEWCLTDVARTIYMLFSSCALLVLMSYWQPIPEVHIWYINTHESPILALFFLVAHWALWIILFLEVLVMKPLHLSGFYQACYTAPSASYNLRPQLQKLLEHMPHAGATCFIAILWVHPYMTFDRMILSTVLTAYLCCGLTVTGADYSYVEKCSFKSTRTVYSKQRVAR